MAGSFQILLRISQKEFVKLSTKILIVVLIMKMWVIVWQNIINYYRILILLLLLLYYYRILSCNNSYSNKIDEKFKTLFENKFKFCNNDINKFSLLLRKCVYCYKYTKYWEKFNETSLPRTVIFTVKDSNYNLA